MLDPCAAEILHCSRPELRYGCGDAKFEKALYERHERVSGCGADHPCGNEMLRYVAAVEKAAPSKFTASDRLPTTPAKTHGCRATVLAGGNSALMSTGDRHDQYNFLSAEPPSALQYVERSHDIADPCIGTES